MGTHKLTKKQKKELKRIFLAAICYVVLLILEHTKAIPVVFGNRFLSLLVYLIPYLIVGGEVVRSAFLSIRNHQLLDETFLMVIASIGAFASGQLSEAVAVMLFYQVGEWFQDYAVRRSRGSIQALLDIAPEYANVEREDGTVETVDPDEVQIGDVLVIRPGDKIPVDGTVLEGSSMIYTAALTGEPVPRSAGSGSELISGCINGDGLLKMRANKRYDDSTVARILEMVENASEKKSRTENFITRFARYYTPIVVAAAVVIAVIPALVTGEWLTWIYRACTFLVISCPCALVLSVPLAFFGGIGAASKNGILVKGSNYLELMAQLGMVVSDKTGTLTRGNFRVTHVEAADGVSSEEVLEAAALAEGMSTHPIANSIREALGTGEKEMVSTKGVTESENLTGRGIRAAVNGHTILVGNEKLMQEEEIAHQAVKDDASTVVCVARDGVYLGTIVIQDEIKPEAAQAISVMKNEGVQSVVMLTGDRKSVGEAVGRTLGVDRVYSELLPQDKVLRMEQLLQSENEAGRKVAFLGDGINDAPVLTRADVGIAMGAMGSDAAIEAADIVIMDDDLNKIPATIQIARKTVAISKEDIVFALIVKILILILGAIGIANMWAAVFSDVGVAVLCILNSMRLLVYRPKSKSASRASDLGQAQPE